MLEIFSGTILIDGVDIQSLPRNILRPRLNALPQHPFFLHGSVRHNLDPTGTVRDVELVQSLRKVGLWGIFTGGLDGDLRVEDLSHGQRQLFSLATAILRKSKIVVFDEVTSK
jgi:ATP-binding cassette subfamily C (CFTR/MRP) protein 1